MSDACKIEVAFVNADLLDIRSERAQIVHEFPAAPRIELMIRRNNRQVRTFSQSAGDRLRSFNLVERLRRQRFCQYDAVACGAVSSYNRRNRPDVCPIRIFLQEFEGCPAQISGIYINMKNNGIHQITSLFREYRLSVSLLPV